MKKTKILSLLLVLFCFGGIVYAKETPRKEATTTVYNRLTTLRKRINDNPVACCLMVFVESLTKWVIKQIQRVISLILKTCRKASFFSLFVFSLSFAYSLTCELTNLLLQRYIKPYYVKDLLLLLRMFEMSLGLLVIFRCLEFIASNRKAGKYVSIFDSIKHNVYQIIQYLRNGRPTAYTVLWETSLKSIGISIAIAFLCANVWLFIYIIWYDRYRVAKDIAREEKNISKHFIKLIVKVSAKDINGELVENKYRDHHLWILKSILEKVCNTEHKAYKKMTGNSREKSEPIVYEDALQLFKGKTLDKIKAVPNLCTSYAHGDEKVCSGNYDKAFGCSKLPEVIWHPECVYQECTLCIAENRIKNYRIEPKCPGCRKQYSLAFAALDSITEYMYLTSSMQREHNFLGGKNGNGLFYQLMKAVVETVRELYSIVYEEDDDSAEDLDEETELFLKKIEQLHIPIIRHMWSAALLVLVGLSLIHMAMLPVSFVLKTVICCSAFFIRIIVSTFLTMKWLCQKTTQGFKRLKTSLVSIRNQ